MSRNFGVTSSAATGARQPPSSHYAQTTQRDSEAPLAQDRIGWFFFILSLCSVAVLFGSLYGFVHIRY